MVGRSRLSSGLILLFSLAVGAFAPGPRAQQEDKRASTTVAGSLKKADEPDVFAISDENGKNYELVSRNIKLSAHVGHEVRVVGTLLEEEGEEQEGEARDGWAGKIYVTSLRMVSDTCK
jgi:hypothetical protein